MPGNIDTVPHGPPGVAGRVLSDAGPFHSVALVGQRAARASVWILVRARYVFATGSRREGRAQLRAGDPGARLARTGPRIGLPRDATPRRLVWGDGSGTLLSDLHD